jgi:type II secretory pathway component PulF
VIHLAAVLLAIPPAVLAGDAGVFLRDAAVCLGAFYLILAVCFGCVSLIRKLFASSDGAADLLGRLPLIGGWLLAWTGARFTAVFGMLVRSGSGPLKALEIAGRACGNARLRALALAAIPGVKAGSTLAEALASARPREIARALSVGETSGRLDDEAEAAAQRLEESAIARLDAFAEWLPRLLYIGVTLYVGWRIVETALTIGNSVGSALDLG